MQDHKQGKNCQYPYCNQLDYLNFYCGKCDKNLCLEHRHIEVSCPFKKSNDSDLGLMKSEKANIVCFKCNKRFFEFQTQNCKSCGKTYCVKDRLEFDHDCKSLRNELKNTISLKIFENKKSDPLISELDRETTLLELIFFLNKNIDEFYLFKKVGDEDNYLPIDVQLDRFLKDGDSIVISTLA